MSEDTSLYGKQERTSLTQEEWKKFWEREYTILLRVAKMLLRNEEDAQDVVHDACQSLLGGWKGREAELTSLENVRGYLSRALKFHYIDTIRKRATGRKKLEELYQQSDVLMGDASKSLNPEMRKILNELPDDIQQVAKQLSPRLKDFCLFLFGHLDSEREDLWQLWAKRKGIDPSDHRERNIFDQLKHRLRQELAARGVYASLRGESKEHAKQ